MKRRSRESATADITPLVDVVFLLLIFFMVSTVFKKDELALLLSLPHANAEGQTQQADKSLTIELSAQEIAYNGQKITLNELGGELSQVKDKNIPIQLRIDKQVVYERIVGILDKLKKYKLVNLELITNH